PKAERGAAEPIVRIDVWLRGETGPRDRGTAAAEVVDRGADARARREIGAEVGVRLDHVAHHGVSVGRDRRARPRARDAPREADARLPRAAVGDVLKARNDAAADLERLDSVRRRGRRLAFRPPDAARSARRSRVAELEPALGEKADAPLEPEAHAGE